MDTYNGYVFQIIGDAFCVAFHTANDAIQSAIKAQTDLFTEEWGDMPIKVRMGIHSGSAKLLENGGFQGYLAMSHVQRVMSAAHGGQVLISSATHELVHDDLSNDVSLRDMGERRLKDLIRPEHIFQLYIANLPSEFPPLKTLEKYRHNLPEQMTSFIGREKEIAEIKQALGEHRLVTLTGSGGTGKTRLSLQVAADLLDQFPDGIWFVELALIIDPVLIPQAILSAADMQTQQGRSALDSLVDFLREKTSLVVLDNCEHLIEACAKLVETLLSTAPNLKILASSREALGAKGEQAWRVPSLSIPDLKHLPPVPQLSQYEAVRLFIDRALLIQPHFTVTNENAPAVAQICFRLDGIPLAIELAAARIRLLSAEQISYRLDDRFRLLTGNSRTALPRQQTLRALIDWSYDLLTEDEKLLLRRMSVFIGGWTLDLAEQVCSDEKINSFEILDMLGKLVDKSLVTAAESGAEIRYHLLETVRQYAREKLFESGEGETARNKHLKAFVDLAEKAEPELRSFNQPLWLDRIEAEIENLRAALEWAQARDSESYLRLASAIWRFCEIRLANNEIIDYLKTALDATKGLSTIDRARALGRVATILNNHGMNAQALDYAKEACKLGRELNDAPSIAMGLSNEGMAELSNDSKYAVECLEKALAFSRSVQDHRVSSAILAHLGNEALVRKDFSHAIEFCEESLQEARLCGDKRAINFALRFLSNANQFSGNLPASKKQIEEAISLAQEINDKANVIVCIDSLIGDCFLAEDFARAEQLCIEAHQRARETGVRSSIAITLVAHGILNLAQGDLATARECAQEALVLTENVYSYTDALLLFGKASCQMGELSTANEKFHEVLLLYKKENLPDGSLACLAQFGILAFTQGKLKRAVKLFAAIDRLQEHILIYEYPFELRQREGILQQAHQQLGEDAFNKAWLKGRAMTMEQAIAYVLEETP
jgi:predicted ATPase